MKTTRWLRLGALVLLATVSIAGGCRKTAEPGEAPGDVGAKAGEAVESTASRKGSSPSITSLSLPQPSQFKDPITAKGETWRVTVKYVGWVSPALGEVSPKQGEGLLMLDLAVSNVGSSPAQIDVRKHLRVQTTGMGNPVCPELWRFQRSPDPKNWIPMSGTVRRTDGTPVPFSPRVELGQSVLILKLVSPVFRVLRDKDLMLLVGSETGRVPDRIGTPKPKAEAKTQGQASTVQPPPGKASQPSAEAVQHYQAGLKFKEAKDYDNAVAELTKAVELAPGYTEAHYALAWVWLAKTEKEKAIAEFKEVLRLAPESEKGKEAKAALGRLEVPLGPSGKAVPTRPMTLKVRQSPKNPLWLLVDVPWRNFSGATISVTFVTTGNGKRAEDLFIGFHSKDLKGAVGLTKGLASSSGMKNTGTFEQFDLVAFENHLSKIAAYAVGKLTRGEPPKVIGAAAGYFDLPDWAVDQKGLLEIELDSDYFTGKGEVCVWLVSKDGKKLAHATSEIVLK